MSKAAVHGAAPAAASAPKAFEPEFVEYMRQLFEERIAFNAVIGLKIVSMRPDGVEGRVDMKPQLVGHFAYNRMHGGVISATLDAMAGLAVLSAIAGRHMDEPPRKRMERFARLGTIDLRVDYLRPAIGETFTARAQVLRLGSRVASARMEFLDSEGGLLSSGAAAYIVS